MLPEFIPLWKDATLDFKFDAQSLTIQRLPDVVDRLTARLQFALDHANGSGRPQGPVSAPAGHVAGCAFAGACSH